MTIRVLVADDQAVVHDGVVLLLSSADDIAVVGEAADGATAVALATELRPDVALLDLRMPELDGAAATAQIVAARLGVRVLVLTTFADDSAVMPALRAGAVGYLTKDVTSEALLAAVRDVAAGRTVLDPAVQQRLVEMIIGNPPPNVPPPSVPPASPPPAIPVAAAPGGAPEDVEGLTRREVDVVRLVAQGFNNRQVARELYVSEATVKTHLNHLLSKLAMDDRAALIAWAWHHGLAGEARQP